MTLVAILTVRKSALDAFRTFETRAAAVMARHGGRIERTVVVGAGSPSDLFKEVHVVTFPTENAFTAYRNDGALRALSRLRAEAVVHTEVLAGEDGPSYGPE